MNKHLVMLMILDGFGINPNIEANAIKLANTPNFDRYLKNFSNNIVHASGLDVGLPDGQIGNSEVGHINIGAGRIVYQEFVKITKSIQEGNFFDNLEFAKAVDNCKSKGTALHLLGLVSDGGVHSHNTHLYALLKLAKLKGLKEVYVHCFTDGRDVPPSSAEKYIKELEENMKEIGVGKIATISGRYYAMDRDKRWDRVKLAYDALVNGKGVYQSSAVDAIKNSYSNGVTDEFIKPTVIDKFGMIKANDSVIFFNFRHDRAREITRSLVDEDFKEFDRENGFFPLVYVCMTQYDETMPNVYIAYKPVKIVNTLGEILSKRGLKQLRIAETEKYAHVTYFFNGGEEKVFDGEDRILVKSPSVATYDLKPSMSAVEVTEKVLSAIESTNYDVIILNYANPDMVGHTGVLKSAIEAVEVIDDCMGKVVEKVLEYKGEVLITADHGNIEQMIDYDTKKPHTAHTTNPVPIILAGRDIKLKEGRLADLAPTLLDLIGIEKPIEMTGESLLDY